VFVSDREYDSALLCHSIMLLVYCGMYRVVCLHQACIWAHHTYVWISPPKVHLSLQLLFAMHVPAVEWVVSAATRHASILQSGLPLPLYHVDLDR